MRSLCVFLVLVLGGGLQAQESENGLIGRSNAIPDPNRVSAMQDKAFTGGGALRLRPAHGMDKSVEASPSAYLGEYQQTRSFLGIKNPWFGGKVFEAKPARLDKKANEAAEQAVVVQAAATQEFRDANLSQETRAEPFHTRGHAPEGLSQKSLEPLSKKLSKELSIEDIRELLNKNR